MEKESDLCVCVSANGFLVNSRSYSVLEKTLKNVTGTLPLCYFCQGARRVFNKQDGATRKSTSEGMPGTYMSSARIRFGVQDSLSVSRDCWYTTLVPKPAALLCIKARPVAM